MNQVASGAAPALEMRGIRKSFPGVLALNGANLTVQQGEVHALLGGNGAGKSTMVGIVAGVLRPDDGEMRLHGLPVAFNSPGSALRQGVSVIYQELVQVPDLSVAENILLGRLPRSKAGLVDWKRAHRIAAEALAELGLDLDTWVRLSSLPTGLRQQVEIVRAINAQPKILILDEPTSALTGKEVDNLFALLRRLKAQGRTLIYISHHLDEIFALTDRLTVLRDGRDVLTTISSAIASRDLATAMVGQSLDLTRRRKRPPVGAPRLVAKGLRTDRLSDVSLTLSAGEIVGLAGVLGAGRTELLRALAGVDPLQAGTIAVDGRQLKIHSPADAINAGVVLVPEDRKTEGLILDMSVAANITLPFLGRFSRWGFLAVKARAALVNTMIDRLGIRTPSQQQSTRKLSGGNQQKTILARWVSAEALILLLDQPLRGLDVLAKNEVYQKIDELAETGVAIVFAATELGELLNCCHRVLILRDGALVETIEDLNAINEAELAHRTMRGEHAGGTVAEGPRP
jgi:ABC-type sugar transport system ATPase subunit